MFRAPLRFPAAAALLAVGASLAAAQPEVRSEAELKAALLLKILGFIEWPSSPRGSKGPFRIGFLARSPVARACALQARGLSFGGRPVQVSYVAPGESPEGFQVLFLPNGAGSRAAQPLAGCQGKPILTAGESRGACEKGMMLAVFLVEDHMGFDVNLPRIKESRLVVNSQILHLAEKVHEGGLP